MNQNQPSKKIKDMDYFPDDVIDIRDGVLFFTKKMKKKKFRIKIQDEAQGFESLVGKFKLNRKAVFLQWLYRLFGENFWDSFWVRRF